MTAKELIQKYIIEKHLSTFVLETPELARFFDSSGELVEAGHLEEVMELIEKNSYYTFQDALYEFDNEQGERIENFGIEEGSWPHYYKAFEIDGKIVAWQHSFGGGKHCEYGVEWLEEAFFVKRGQQARVVYIYEDLRKK